MTENNGWNRYELLVLQELKELRETCEQLEKGQEALNGEFIALKTERRIGLYVGGLILPAVVALVFTWVGRKFGF